MPTEDNPFPTETIVYQPDAVVGATTDIDLPTVCPGASQYRSILQAVRINSAGAVSQKLTIAAAAPGGDEIWLKDGTTIQLGDATAANITYLLTMEKGYYSKAGA